MSWIDWTIVFAAGVFITWICFSARKYLNGVADFLAANRSAGRYMMMMSGAMASVGAIAVIAIFEAYNKRGFPPVWWEMLYFPATAVALMTGWLVYRFRETRCLTMAQFYEARYSRTFRIYAGIIMWASGIVNFGIFPAVATRFFVYFCGLPNTCTLLGVTMQTYVPLMIVTLGLALVYTTIGGHISVMLSDCVQGMFCSVGFVILSFYILHKFGWADISQVLMSREVVGESLLNPYNTSHVEDFNVWFYLIAIFGMFYGFISWQGAQSYNSCALNPHEAKMGGIIGGWRLIPQNVMVVLMPVCVIAFMNLPKYATEAAKVQAVLDTTPTEYLAGQVKVGVALAHILPVGLKGMFCAMMLFFLITTQDTYLHSWGAIFIQDVVMPIRNKPLTPRQHVNLLRWSIVFVAVFAYFFSVFYEQKTYIRMFQAITGAIVAGAGTVIIGGLYWRRGTKLAAWVAMTVGWVLSIGRILLDQIQPQFADVASRGVFLQVMDKLCAPNRQVYWFYTMLACIGSYIIISLLTSRERFDLERMLHRGDYDEKGEHVKAVDEKPKSIWLRLVNITEEFSIGDRVIAVGYLVWNAIWLVAFGIGTVYSLFVSGGGFSTEAWARFWHVWVWTNLLVGAPVTLWLVVGGWHDIRKCLERLRTLQRDDRDDGAIVGHHLADEEDAQEVS